jgi:HEAT repeat protein
MPKTTEEIIKIFNRVKPDYSNVIDNLDDEDYPIVQSLIDDDNLYLASKVVSYIGHLKSQNALSGLAIAARNKKSSIRAVAAYALRNFISSPEAINLINELLEDPNLGVRKFALRTVSSAKLVNFKEKIKLISQTESNERMKRLTSKVKDDLDKLDNSNVAIL